MTSVGQCSEEGCTLAVGGGCIEGFEDPTKCPNFLESDSIAQSESTIEEVPISPAKEPITETISLSSGKALTGQEANSLTAEQQSSMIILMGMAKSGKTTLLAELYEKFRRGSFAGYLFAGSRTLLGFEEICHLARAASEGKEEDTGRTIPGINNNLMHLDLYREDGSKKKRFLLTDLSGEIFEKATRDSEKLKAIPYLKRANHVVLFADAEKLSRLGERQSLLNQMLVLIRGCTEEKFLDPGCKVTLVISRHDLWQEGIDDKFQKMMIQKLTARMNGYFTEELQFVELAARPPGGVEAAYGLDKVIDIWLHDTDRNEVKLPLFENSAKLAIREIDRIALKGT